MAMLWTVIMTMVTLVVVAFFPGLVMPVMQGMATMVLEVNMPGQLFHC
jgi:hypothetical protein